MTNTQPGGLRPPVKAESRWKPRLVLSGCIAACAIAVGAVAYSAQNSSSENVTSDPIGAASNAEPAIGPETNEAPQEVETPPATKSVTESTTEAEPTVVAESVGPLVSTKDASEFNSGRTTWDRTFAVSPEENGDRIYPEQASEVYQFEGDNHLLNQDPSNQNDEIYPVLQVDGYLYSPSLTVGDEVDPVTLEAESIFDGYIKSATAQRFTWGWTPLDSEDLRSFFADPENLQIVELSNGVTTYEGQMQLEPINSCWDEAPWLICWVLPDAQKDPVGTELPGGLTMQLDVENNVVSKVEVRLNGETQLGPIDGVYTATFTELNEPQNIEAPSEDLIATPPSFEPED